MKDREKREFLFNYLFGFYSLSVLPASWLRADYSKPTTYVEYIQVN